MAFFSPHQQQQRPTSPAPTPTTDFTLLESQKENIRPLATGRSAATLSALFVKESSSAERVVQEGHERCLKDIEEAERRDKEGEDMVEGVQDVLELYNRYILFTMQHHPSSASHLVPLLESTTRRFLGDQRYSQDIRYLKLWVTYARHVERREEIFAFLESRDIGTKHSALYEEWATAAEGLKRNKKADDVFRLGIARQAAPLERLKRLYKEFLSRHILGPDGRIPEDEPLPTRTPSRSVLGAVGSTSSLPTSSISGAITSAATPRSGAGTRNPNGSKMEIFADGPGASGEDGSAPEWMDFGTRDGRRKENVVEAGPWKGEVLPQSAARNRIAPRTPKVEVFKDESTGKDEGVRQADDVFSRSKQSTTEAELLKSDPLRHYDTSSVSTCVPVPPSLPAPPTSRKPKASQQQSTMKAPTSTYIVNAKWVCPQDGPDVKNSAGGIERRMFDWNNVYKGGEEYSFEEVRARERGLLGKEWKGEIKEWEVNWHAPGSSTPKVEKKKSMPSPTVNTKLADEDVRGMFNQTIGAGHRDSDSESDSDSDGSAEEEDDDMVQPLPTPLPPRATTMLSSTGLVPPTPTPAPGHVTQNRMFAPPLNVFEEKPVADENAVPQSAGRGRINVFTETPAKTPLAARTPLGMSSTSKPKAFEVLQEDPEVEEELVPVPQSVNIFATPALLEKRPSRAVGFQPLIENDEEEATDVDENREAQYDNQAYEEFEVRPMHGRPLRHHYEHHKEFREMTPITERTCEYTQTTNRTSMGRRFSTMSEAEEDYEGDKAVVLSAPLEGGISGLSVIEETSNDLPEFERRPADLDRSVETDGQTSPTSANFSCSGLEPNFQLPEGYTIQGRSEVTRTMVLVDGVEVGGGRDSIGSSNATGAFVTATSGLSPIEIPNPCVPNDEDIVNLLLSKIEPPLSSITGFIDLRHTSLNQLDKLHKQTKATQRRGSASSSSRASIAHDEGYILSLDSRKFEIKDKIGEGGFGAVFLGVDIKIRQEMDDMDSDDEEEDAMVDRSLVAIKVEKPSSVWEFSVLSRIHSRIEETIRKSIINCHQLYAFSDESYLLIDYCSQGTLLDVVNKAGSIGISPAVSGTTGGVDELVAIFFMVELLKIIEGLHNSGFIHGDLKIDNCLIRLDDIPSSEGGPSSWSTQYHNAGDQGWSHKGLKLIDFGRAIDLELFEARDKQRFVADWPVDERDCWEVKEGREWAWENDYFGIAGVGYCLLFGKYIQTEFVGEGSERKCKISTPLKRYWQTELWNELFDVLLNPPKDSLPCTSSLTDARSKFEAWLEENCQKGGKSLKAFLKKIELGAMVRR